MLEVARMKFFWICILLVLLAACSNRTDELDLSAYKYNDTKNMIRFVHTAANKLEMGGIKALAEYRNPRGSKSDYYLYVYDMNGLNLFHAGMPEMENKNFLDIIDKDGKYPIHMVLEAIQNPENPHGWIHYSWWEPGKFYPVPKSSCHFKVTLPDGRKVFIGCGINFPLEEGEFARIAVDSAVNLIEATGSAAIPLIADAKSSYNFREVKVFAFRANGSILISPVLGDSLFRANLLSCMDEVGHKPFEHALQQLEQSDAVWQIFMGKSRYERQLEKKVLYLRKTMLDNEPLFVGAITDLPQTP